MDDLLQLYQWLIKAEEKFTNALVDEGYAAENYWANRLHEFFAGMLPEEEEESDEE